LGGRVIFAETSAALPAFQTRSFIALAFAATLVSGCSTVGDGEELTLGLAPSAGLASESLAAADTSTYVFDGEAQLALPESVEILPSAFAGTTPTAPAYQVASLTPADLGLPATVQQEPVMVAPTPMAEDDDDDVSRGEVDGLIEKYAELYEVPVMLVRRVVKRESNFNPGAYNRGHWGLMQIKHATARGMGYEGDAKGLLDAETNLKFAVKYLRGAFLVAKGDMARADRFYQTGYYYDAKRMGLLGETGLGRDRKRRRAA
jgi:soluble lytic murein transglycosylase-like protein